MRILINKAPVEPPAPLNTVAAVRLPTLADIMRPENNNFALIRLLMALAVVVSHSWWLATGRPSEEPLHFWTNHSLGEHAVQVFFFLSGVVVTQSLFKSRSGLDFACARALRIFPALIICVLLTALVLGPMLTSLGLGTYFGNAGVVAYIVKTVSLATGSAPLPGVFGDNPVSNLVNLSLWTLKYEVLCYVLLGLFGFLYLSLPKLRTALTIALGLIVALIFVGTPKPIAGYTATDNMRYFILFFGAGTLAYLLRKRLVLSWLALPLLFLAFTLSIGTRFAELSSALFLGYGTLLVAGMKLPRLRTFTNNQDYSYAVYILHCPIQQALVQLQPGIDPVELLLVTLLTVLPLAIVSWTYIEHPAMRLRKTVVGWLRASLPSAPLAAAIAPRSPVTTKHRISVPSNAATSFTAKRTRGARITSMASTELWSRPGRMASQAATHPTASPTRLRGSIVGHMALAPARTRPERLAMRKATPSASKGSVTAPGASRNGEPIVLALSTQSRIKPRVAGRPSTH